MASAPFAKSSRRITSQPWDWNLGIRLASKVEGNYCTTASFDQAFEVHVGHLAVIDMSHMEGGNVQVVDRRSAAVTRRVAATAAGSSCMGSQPPWRSDTANR